jgi:hypothetical protein
MDKSFRAVFKLTTSVFVPVPDMWSCMGLLVESKGLSAAVRRLALPVVVVVTGLVELIVGILFALLLRSWFLV